MKTLSFVGCNPYKLVPIMKIIVANAITNFKSTMIETYSKPPPPQNQTPIPRLLVGDE